MEDQNRKGETFSCSFCVDRKVLIRNARSPEKEAATGGCVLSPRCSSLRSAAANKIARRKRRRRRKGRISRESSPSRPFRCLALSDGKSPPDKETSFPFFQQKRTGSVFSTRFPRFSASSRSLGVSRTLSALSLFRRPKIIGVTACAARENDSRKRENKRGCGASLRMENPFFCKT